MSGSARNRVATMLAAGLFAALMLLDGRVGLNLNDEGFLWYGTLRTSQGEVPLRDFPGATTGRRLVPPLGVERRGDAAQRIGCSALSDTTMRTVRSFTW